MTDSNAIINPTVTPAKDNALAGGVVQADKFDTAVTTAQTDRQPETPVHTVKKNETLWSISKKYYGDGTKYEAIMSANILDSDRLQPGMRLTIPSKQQANQPRPQLAQPETKKESVETVWQGVDLKTVKADSFKTVPLAMPDNPQTLPTGPALEFDPTALGVDLFPIGKELPKTEMKVVLPGETYSSIAQQYLGDENKYPELMSLNDTKNDRLMPGDEITIPYQTRHEPITVPLTKHEKRVEMFGEANTKKMEHIEKVEHEIKGMDISKMGQLPTADLSKDPVNGGQTGTSGFYGAVLMNAQNGGVDKAKAAKFFGEPVANFLQKMPTGTKFELYTDNLETYFGDQAAGNDWGHMVMQIRAAAVPKFIEGLPKPIAKSIVREINKLPKVQADFLMGVGESVQNNKAKSVRDAMQLPAGKTPKTRKNKQTGKMEKSPQFDTQHWNNARIRIGITMRDLMNASAHGAGKVADAITGTNTNVEAFNLEPETQGMSALEKAFDSATVGINYDIMMDGSKVPMLNGTNFYAQIRTKPQDINANHGGGNNSGQEGDLIFLIGAESGDANDFVVNSQEKEKTRRKLKLPKSKGGAIARGVGEGIKAILPGTTGLGINIQFTPNAAKAMVNQFGERVYVANIDGKNIALPPAMTPTIDMFAAPDNIADGHAPLKKPDMTLEEYITDELTSKVISSTPVKDAAYAALKFFSMGDGDEANMEFGQKVYESAYKKYAQTHPEFANLTPTEKRKVGEMILTEVQKLTPDVMTTDGNPFKDFKGYVDEVLHNTDVQSRAYGTF